jgi:hypothetical protein
MNTPQTSTTYWTEATVTIKLQASENDGKSVVEIDPGHLRKEDVLALALQALTDQIVEWFMPTPIRND